MASRKATFFNVICGGAARSMQRTVACPAPEHRREGLRWRAGPQGKPKARVSLLIALWGCGVLVSGEMKGGGAVIFFLRVMFTVLVTATAEKSLLSLLEDRRRRAQQRCDWILPSRTEPRMTKQRRAIRWSMVIDGVGVRMFGVFSTYGHLLWHYRRLVHGRRLSFHNSTFSESAYSWQRRQRRRWRECRFQQYHFCSFCICARNTREIQCLSWQRSCDVPGGDVRKTFSILCGFLFGSVLPYLSRS